MSKSRQRQITARARAAASGSADSAFIDAMYAIGDRLRDHAGLPELDNPVLAKPKPAFKDPAKFLVKDTPASRARITQLRWLAEFRSSVRSDRQAHRDAYELIVAERARALAPIVAHEPGKAEAVEAPTPEMRTKADALAHARVLAHAAAEALARAEAMPETAAQAREFFQAKADRS